MEKITARMKWIVKQLKDHEGAVITHRRDWFWEKSLYALEWSENGHDFQAYVTTKMRQQLSKAGLIEIVEERPIYDGDKFRTTERDWGLPKRQPTQRAPDKCPRCNGRGKVRSTSNSDVMCPLCKGAGTCG